MVHNNLNNAQMIVPTKEHVIQPLGNVLVSLDSLEMIVLNNNPSNVQTIVQTKEIAIHQLENAHVSKDSQVMIVQLPSKLEKKNIACIY